MNNITSNDPMRVVVIGCGGIGTWLASGLAKALQFHRPNSSLFFIDGDSFEPKNAERQQFSHMGNKAYVLRDDLQPAYPNVFCFAEAAWIVSESSASVQDKEVNDEDNIVVGRITAESVLEEGDIVFVCVDNHAARKLIFDAASKYSNIDVLTGGNDDALEGTIYHYRRRDGKDITLHPGVIHPEIQTPTDKNPGELSCQERAELDGGTQLLSINMAVASYLLGKFAHCFLGTETQLAEAMEKAEMYFDLALGLSQPYDRRVQSTLATNDLVSATSLIQ